MNCPHCKKLYIKKDGNIAFYNTKSYGSNRFYFQCQKCKKKFSAYFELIVKRHKPQKEDDDCELSF